MILIHRFDSKLKFKIEIQIAYELLFFEKRSQLYPYRICDSNCLTYRDFLSTHFENRISSNSIIDFSASLGKRGHCFIKYR